MDYKDYKHYLEEVSDSKAHVISNKYGFVVYILNNNIIHINDLYIKPEHRGKDLASILCKSILNEVNVENFHTATAHIQKTNPNYKTMKKIAVKNEWNIFYEDDNKVTYKFDLRRYHGRS